MFKGGMASMMQKAQKMQEDMQKAQAEIKDLTATGIAAGGAVLHLYAVGVAWRSGHFHRQQAAGAAGDHHPPARHAGAAVRGDVLCHPHRYSGGGD